METHPTPAEAGRPCYDARTVLRLATIGGVSFVLGCALLALGIWLGLDHAARRLGGTIHDHGAAVDRVSGVMQQHGKAIVEAGGTIAHPEIRIVDDVPIKQPVQVRGPAEDGALPVDARLAK